jgi:hypothetical protein
VLKFVRLMDTRPRSISSPSSTFLLQDTQQQEISVHRLRNRNVKRPPTQPDTTPTHARMNDSLTGILITIILENLFLLFNGLLLWDFS